MRLPVLVIMAMLPEIAVCQSSVIIRIDTARTQGPKTPVWNYFGYDEPNYTYAPNGSKLIAELSALSATPVHIRTHNLLTTGDGSAALKWGSTNAYTEDSSGKAVYSWTIVDRILETYLQAGAKPLVEIGFMPKALSTRPDPYQHNFPQGNVFTGWSYPPTSYEKWSELVYRLVSHCVSKYGKAEAASWDWEVWNEPDIAYWHGTPEEYDKLYDYTVSAVRRGLAEARVGGPGSTGPGAPKAAAFLRQFLQHCTEGKNYATGATGAPLDFISFHVKGRPTLAGGNVEMGLAHELKDASEGFKIVRSFEPLAKLPIILTEADPEGCAACSARTNPANAYRNGTLYPTYTAVAMKAIEQMAAREGVNLQGVLTWAFEFENQPYFEGFRTLATNGVDKPVLNVFRMLGLMRGDAIPVESSAATPVDTLLERGAKQSYDIDAIATRTDRSVTVMIWNYRDEEAPGPAADVRLELSGLGSTRRMLLRQYRIDQEHSNAFTVWKRLGSPQRPSAEAYESLEGAGQLQEFASPQWVSADHGGLDFTITMPTQSVALLELGW